MTKSILQTILDFNKERDPLFVQLKYLALLESPFRFFRGTCHLFHNYIKEESFIFNSPRIWLCGDMHLENFGSYKGVHRLYFDMNDFDEAFLGPCLIDIVRLCTSIYLISYSSEFDKQKCRNLISEFLRAYATTLQEGDAYFLEENTAAGFLKKFLTNIRKVKREDLLQKRMSDSGKLKLQYDGIKTFKVSKESKKAVKKALKDWVEKNYVNPAFFQVLHIVHRAMGTGSLGNERYMVLVQGDKLMGNFLLDIKLATPPCALLHYKYKQPKWANEAARITSVQRRVQAGLPLFFSEITINKRAFVIKEKQPEESKVNYIELLKKPEKLTQLMQDLGELVAWNTLRSGGRQGSAIADVMVNFGKKIPTLEKQIIGAAERCAEKAVQDWNLFKKEYQNNLTPAQKKQPRRKAF